MSKNNIGRPTDNPKKVKIEFRADELTVKKLDECVKEYSSNRSQIIRDGISEMHKKIRNLHTD